MKRIISLLLLLQITLIGQSAYYRLGYGDLFPETDPFANSIGIGSVALQDSAHVTLHNPASLNNLNRVYFGVALGSDFRSIDDVVSNNTRLEQMNIVLPMGEKFGMSLGVQAISDFKSDYTSTLDAGTFSERSDGGLWDYQIGLGYNISPVMKAGLKLHRFQGLLRRETSVTMDDIQELYVVKGNISGSSFEAGVLSDVGDKVTLGLTVNVPVDKPVLSGRDSLGGSSSYNDLEEELTAWPTIINFGIVYHHSPTMNFIAGIGQELFSETGFDDARIFSLPEGWHTVPVASFQLAMQKRATDRTSRSWNKRTGFQTGVSIKNYYLVPEDDTMIFEYALTSGLNLGLRNGRSLFEISGELGSRGGEESLPSELYARVKFGIQINDIWFRKVKRR